MIFGTPIEPPMIVFGGFLLLSVLVFQMLVGMRKIKFKSRPLQSKVHKWAAWAMLGLALLHALSGLLYLSVIG